MDKIDPKLAELLKSEPDTKHLVLINCKGDCAPVLSAIKALGQEPGAELEPLNIVTAVLTSQQVHEMAALPAVDRIEPDEEASTQ